MARPSGAALAHPAAMSPFAYRILGGAVVLSAACLGACFGMTNESTGTAASDLHCAADQRAFNGACRDTCSNVKPCSGDTRCAEIDPSSALCLETSTTCAYLDSDTECAARGGFYAGGGRGGPQTYVPYSSYPYDIDPSTLTDYSDPYFNEFGYNTYSYGYTSQLGCQGNAHWVTVPAQGNVACTGTHQVNRCRLNQYEEACILVPGTTPETVLPAQ